MDIWDISDSLDAPKVIDGLDLSDIFGTLETLSLRYIRHCITRIHIGDRTYQCGYDTENDVNMTLNQMLVEQSGHFVTWTHARDHGMNSLSFLLLFDFGNGD